MRPRRVTIESVPRSVITTIDPVGLNGDLRGVCVGSGELCSPPSTGAMPSAFSRNDARPGSPGIKHLQPGRRARRRSSGWRRCGKRSRSSMEPSAATEKTLRSSLAAFVTSRCRTAPVRSDGTL